MTWAHFRFVAALLASLLLTTATVGADQPQGLVLLPCAPGNPNSASCNPSKKDLKQAKAAFAKAMKLESGHHPDQALDEFDRATQLDPRNVEYFTALALTRQQLVYRYLQSGNQALAENHAIEAQADFRSALNLDPDNDFAKQRMQDALAEWLPKTTGPAQIVAEAPEIAAAPNPDHHDFHFRGDSRALLSQVAEAYGLTINVDDSVTSRRVWFDIGDADFAAAMQAACDVTHSFWAPLSEKQIVAAAETPENHRQFDPVAMRTFYFPGVTQAAELPDLVNSLRVVFGILQVSTSAQAGTIELRARQQNLDAATKFIDGLDSSRPQVMLDIEVYEVDHQLMRNIGVHLPNNFNLYNIPAEALAGLGGQSIQSLINQVASGGLSAVAGGGLAALLAQLESGQGIFSQPLATFGGGKTFSGITLDQLVATLSLNESMVRNLQHASLRVSQNNEATFKLGERYPVLTASFSSSFSSPAISQLLGSAAGGAAASALAGSGALQTPFPSFQFEDIGLNLKAKPVVYSDSTVALALEVQLRSLGTQSVNGVPVISNREYKGSIQLKDGEPAVVSSFVSHNEERSMTGIPGLGYIPLLNQAMVDNSKTTEDDELLLVVTPHVVNQTEHSDQAIWLAR